MDADALDITKETDYLFLTHNRSDDVAESIDETEGIQCQTCIVKAIPRYTEGGNVSREQLYEETDGEDELSKTRVEVVKLNCEICQKCVGCWVNSNWYPIESLLQCTHNPDAATFALKEVVTAGERLVLWILNQVIFKQYEIEDTQMQFLNIPPEEMATLIWHKFQAIGFYTIRPKGYQPSNHSFSCSNMPVVDLIFVRKRYRGLGLGTVIVEDVVQKYTHQNIGFSKPITTSMYRVLEKYLQKNLQKREHFWEIGNDGYHSNVWLTLCRKAAFLQKITQ